MLPSCCAPGDSALAQHVGLELQQLPHEGQVGRDDLAPLLHEVEGLVQPDAPRVHEIGQADGGGAGDPRLAVHQHPAAALLHRVCGYTSGYETLLYRHLANIKLSLLKCIPRGNYFFLNDVCKFERVKRKQRKLINLFSAAYHNPVVL